MNEFEHEWEHTEQQRHARLLRELRQELATEAHGQRLLTLDQRQAIAALRDIDAGGTQEALPTMGKPRVAVYAQTRHLRASTSNRPSQRRGSSRPQTEQTEQTDQRDA